MPEITTPNSLDQAKAAVQQNGEFAYLLGDDQFDQAFDSMTEADKQAFQSWQIEQAAIRPANVWEVIQDIPANAAGAKIVDAEHAPKFKEAMTAFGFTTDVPPEESIQAGIHRAKEQVRTGQASTILASQPFVEEKQFQAFIADKKRTTVRMANPEDALYIDPALISGVIGHGSWAGRGQNGNGGVANREGGRRTSFEQIADYATRDSQLPRLEDGVAIVITDQGPVIQGQNAHRMSAAKLRNEPVRITNFTIYQ